MAFEVTEQSTASVSGIFKDELNAVIGSGDMTTLIGTLYEEVTEVVINSRDEQDMLNANGATLDGSGNFTLQLDPADNAILVDANEYEIHVLLLEWTYASGAKGGNAEVSVYVKNLAGVS